MKTKVKTEAERDAARLLRAAWDGGIPVEPVSIAHALGLQVLEAQLDSNTLGALVKEPGREPTILLNQNDGQNRRRFTCAHELGLWKSRSTAGLVASFVEARPQF